MVRCQAHFLFPFTIQPQKYFFGGNPARTIVEIAEKENYDLIVIGHRGIGGVKRLMIGSVANEVSRMATCPVFIVK